MTIIEKQTEEHFVFWIVRYSYRENLANTIFWRRKNTRGQITALSQLSHILALQVLQINASSYGKVDVAWHSLTWQLFQNVVDRRALNWRL